MKTTPFKLFSTEKNNYIFTSSENRLFEINEQIYSELKKVKEKKYLLENISEELKKILLSNKLIEQINEIDFQDDNYVYNLVLMISQQCNLRCTYCYGTEGEYNNRGLMSFEIAKKAIDFLMNNAGNRKRINIIFFGGEPLLNKTLIFDIVKYIETLEENTEFSIGKSITTNGTLIDEKFEKYCIEKEIQVKISIDGPININDKFRTYKDGTGTYNDIINNTKILRESKMASARATVTPYNLDQEFIENSLKEDGFVYPGTAFADELFENEDYLRVYKIFSDSFDDLKQLICNEQYEIILEKKPRTLMFLKQIHKSSICEYHCGAGRNMYAVDINGDLYPCQRFVGVSKFKIGSIFTQAENRNTFLNSIRINGNKKNKCQKCWIKNLCQGTCPYTCFALTGSESESLEIICILNRALYEEAVKIYINLTGIQKQKLFEINTDC